MAKERTLKIAMLVPHLGRGGDWVAVKTLTDALKKRGHDLFLISSPPPENIGRIPFDERLELPLNQGARGLLKALICIGRVPEDLDVLHAHSTATLFYALCLRAFWCRDATVIMSYHWETPESGLSRVIKRWIVQRADRVHCLSLQLHQRIQQYFRPDPRRVARIHLGVEMRQFPLADAEARTVGRERCGLPVDATILLFAGRLNPEKNISLVLETMARHEETMRRHRVVFAIAGSGPIQEQLRADVERLGLQTQVRFLGYVRQMRDAYASADLLLLPSTSMETFGLVVVEAALCGVPTLRSDLPGAEDQIRDGREGFVYPVGEPAVFEEKLLTFLNLTPERCREMGLLARERARRMFRIDERAVDFEQMYFDALKDV